ncbi:hypothetical protein [Bradyrhizobium sp. AUGA SZCCT0431]|uniref:hypothetical protein n=1 Tax=Bradyrhizobium sp. AUGA SZCCT0431 TaxID=2807674 RepID=UPI001BACF087|nr:hypothetical protein [Bradyrhizobium sp. AUGA SZCCT0431]MBR1145574.1 hypothetical protein [Bradyrhizobium sp. AUGA SZCCT0431]
MRTSTAYFAGVGTVVAAVVVGLGGGMLISNIVSPHAPKIETSKLELRMSEKPIAATNVSAVAPNAAQNQPQNEPVTTTSTQGQPTGAAASTSPAASPQPTTAAPVTLAAASEKTNPEPVKTPEAAFAKTRDADIRREARRAAEEKRKAERRQHWVERRRPRQDQELREVEEKIREETEPRQVFAAEPARLETPRIRLFDLD